MKCYPIVLLVLICVGFNEKARSQEAPFELPVQLVGFPFIVGSVKLTNFLKKLSYSFSPATYRSRNRRHLGPAFEGVDNSEPFNAAEVEKYVISEFGSKACVFERICAHYANRSKSQPRHQLDWSTVFSAYRKSSDAVKEFYLLSVFMGDIVGSPQLCHQLGKRRGCDEQLLTGGS